MNSYESTLKTNSEPVLPFFCQTQRNRTQISPVRVTNTSFRIAPNQPLTTENHPNLNPHKNLELPSFIHAKTAVAMTCVEVISTEIFERPNHRNHLKPKVSTSKKRFWWQWLLWCISAILILPTTSNAHELLLKAKIYLHLDSSVVTDLPESGKSYLQASQASDFQKAIQKAQEVPPDSPFFSEAQSDIIRWSHVILDIAQGRANQGDLVGAIAAAQLIIQQQPPVQSLLQEAEASVKQWQLQAKSEGKRQNLLTVAQTMIEPTQASAYNRAIAILRQVPTDAQDYQLAQYLIWRWSKQIYLIAHSRAARGDFAGAIAAAQLIPKDSADYEKAHDFMIDWQENLSTEFLF
ncbi:peptidase C14 caspase catalytic subunit p20 [Stanieria sp. NIES-3757]|nr:peptidase C14 caspase catalytic subunit p20 [Stanieria sp. NIES-3757]